jgi:hypothetical protein
MIPDGELKSREKDARRLKITQLFSPFFAATLKIEVWREFRAGLK